MTFPRKKALETFCFFAASTFICAGIFFILPSSGITLKSFAYCIAAGLFGSYIAAAASYRYSENICGIYAEQLISEGVDKQYIKTHKRFGLSLFMRTITFIVIPAFFSNLLIFLVLFQKRYAVTNTNEAIFQVIKVSVIALLNILTCAVFTHYFFSVINVNNTKLRTTLTNVITTGSSQMLIPTTVGDLMQYNVYLLNSTVDRFKALLESTDTIGNSVKHSTDDLSVTSRQLSSTSLEQSAAVKEILTTMEDSNALSQNILRNITNVSTGAEETFQDVSSGFEVVQKIITQMEEIDQSNESIAEGIKMLCQQIDSIGDVVSIINDIADQTRIIAFNAELEAVSAASEGKNFHIVAAEIRRLANSTMNSINEIKNHILTIQGASQNLITAAQRGTQGIQEEAELAGQLGKQFTDIKELADVTSVKSNEISEIISQQTSSFNQIVVTLRQISSGVENFSTLTKTISDTARQMQEVASSLASLRDDALMQ